MTFAKMTLEGILFLDYASYKGQRSSDGKASDGERLLSMEGEEAK